MLLHGRDGQTELNRYIILAEAVNFSECKDPSHLRRHALDQRMEASKLVAVDRAALRIRLIIDQPESFEITAGLDRDDLPAPQGITGNVA